MKSVLLEFTSLVLSICLEIKESVFGGWGLGVRKMGFPIAIVFVLIFTHHHIPRLTHLTRTPAVSQLQIDYQGCPIQSSNALSSSYE
jgi:hypothetical protein